MKVFLLHRDRDFDVRPALRDPIFDAMMSGDLFGVTNARRNLEKAQNSGTAPTPGLDDVLTQDLELETLWGVMAGGDEFLYEMAKRTVLSSLTDPDSIRYRQGVLADCFQNPDVVRQVYQLALDALGSERRVVGGLWSGAMPDRILSHAVQLLKEQVFVLKQLRKVADEQAESFHSEGFTRFFAMIKEELADDYIVTVERHLRDLEFKRGLLQSAELGKGNKGRRYVVRRPREQSWRERLSFGNRSPSHSFTIPPRDDNGFKMLEEIRGKGLNNVANAVMQSADHVKSFFTMLRIELAFYLGCLNLRERLDEEGEPYCFPTPLESAEPALASGGLYDVCLTLHLDGRVVGNVVDANGKQLVMITGANQGGKSTFIRSVGLAQLMMQSGMFVAAESFGANVCNGVFSHFKREEDASMQSGKLDEELARMSEVADQITPGSVLLCNESFASTNEREGSEIARQIIRALLAKEIKVFFVTHMFDLASSLHRQRLPDALFLRAERTADGRRTFRVIEGEPLPTSYGEDSYRRIFGLKADDRASATAEIG